MKNIAFLYSPIVIKFLRLITGSWLFDIPGLVPWFNLLSSVVIVASGHEDVVYDIAWFCISEYTEFNETHQLLLMIAFSIVTKNLILMDMCLKPQLVDTSANAVDGVWKRTFVWYTDNR